MPSVPRQATPVSHRLSRGPQHQTQRRQRHITFMLAVALTLSICAFGLYRLADPLTDWSWSGAAARNTLLGHTALSLPSQGSPPTSRALRKPAATAARKQQDKKIVSTPNEGEKTRTVAVTVTLTGCSGYPPDGAALLQYSLMKQQRLRSTSRYQYHYYVIYHPSARDCAKHLANLNYTLIERESPVLPQDIRGKELRERISDSGCCGETELLKFEAFKMTQHDAVILIDMDAMVLKSLDEAIDLLLDRKVPANAAAHIMHPDRPIPDDLWILYTPDYDVVWPDVKLKPAQGGFVILKPNVTIYNEIMDIVREGQWSRKLGWGTKEAHVGRFYGDETFQGLVPYYFFVRHGSRHSLDLHWCKYNFMNVAPTVPISVGANRTKERCHNNQDECEDCRDRKLEDIASFHFTVCHKPWDCKDIDVHPRPDDKMRLCYQTHQTWFELRSEMEVSWGRSGRGSSKNKTFVEKFLGYCHNYGGVSYEQIKLPYGSISSSSETAMA